MARLNTPLIHLFCTVCFFKFTYHCYISGSFQTDIPADDLIKFNVDQTGYYYVNLPKTMWKRLADALVSNYKVHFKNIFLYFSSKLQVNTPHSTAVNAFGHMYNLTH